MAPFLRCYFSRLYLNSLDKLTSSFFGASLHFNLWIKYDWYRNLDIGHQLIYVAIIIIIKSINHLSAMPSCIYTSINNYVVTLWHHWHKVECRGTSVLISTTISVFLYCTQWCCQYFFVLEQLNQSFDVCGSSSSILFAIIR